MWCDDFDMDLFRVLPEARELLAPVAAVELCTHGGETRGKLNHPSAWSHNAGLVAFFGFKDPHKPAFYSTQHPIVRCTFEEAVRDLWSHALLMLVEGQPVWDSQRVQGEFNLLMYHLRGWTVRDEQEVAQAKARVLDSIRGGVHRLQVVKAQFEAPAGAMP